MQIVSPLTYSCHLDSLDVQTEGPFTRNTEVPFALSISNGRPKEKEGEVCVLALASDSKKDDTLVINYGIVPAFQFLL